jgi:hypothetical protein
MVMLFVVGPLGWLELESRVGDVEVLLEATCEFVEQVARPAGLEDCAIYEYVRRENRSAGRDRPHVHVVYPGNAVGLEYVIADFSDARTMGHRFAKHAKHVTEQCLQGGTR